ncbi:hypothetical protein [Limosilactobacillus sp.]|jgi:hypothetical protein|nr:hypothetical protein [Limosilactobacillus sp.]
MEINKREAKLANELAIKDIQIADLQVKNEELSAQLEALKANKKK